MGRLADQTKFLIEIDKVKGILRQSIVLGDLNRRENDAEHSWHMAICALTLKEYFILGEVDMEKVLKLILIHDIVEIYAGDVPAFSNFNKEEKWQQELDSAERIYGMLPEEQGKDFMKLWLEFENMETKESKFANTFDRFQGFIQNLTSDGHTWKKFKVNKEKVLKRLAPVIEYTPQVFEEFVMPEIQKYIDRGIIKDDGYTYKSIY